jgi:hypothetical protein
VYKRKRERYHLKGMNAVAAAQAQSQRIDRMRREQLQLLGQEGDTSPYVQVKFLVSGSQGGHYNVCLHRNRRMSCSCLDFQTTCRRLGIVCKHVAYVVLNVFRLPREPFFRTYVLSDADFAEALRQSSWPVTPEPPSLQIPTDISPRGREGDCPICLDTLQTSDEPLCRCPECRIVVHTSCVAEWMIRGPKPCRCVYCRSSIWEKWLAGR